MRRLALVFLAAFLSIPSSHAQTGAGTALSFDGVNDYVSISNSAALNVFPLTVMGWIRNDEYGPDRGLINKYAANSFNGYQIYLYEGTLHAWYFRTNGSQVWDGGRGLNGGFLSIFGLSHVAFTVDATGGKLYVNGVLRDSRAWTGTAGAPTTTQELRLGRFDNNFYRGSMDEVSIWNVALSSNAIASAMNRRLATNETGLLAYWRFDEPSGIATADAVPNRAGDNLGTLVGGPRRIVSEVQIGPLVSTTVATQQGLTSARLNGSVTVTAPGLNTTAWFEWGATTNYGSLTPAVNVGNASTSVVMNADITGQFQGRTNHFRLVATNSNGRVNGVNASFSIPAFPGPAGTPPLRSTFYDGSLSQVSYEARPEWDQSVSMTVEAWVYRHDANRFETIVSHSSGFASQAPDSYRLIFSPRLRFYRGTNFAEVATPVSTRKWTHVAVSYDGAIARFYVNGEFAGGRTLNNNGAGKMRPLLLGHAGFSLPTFAPVAVLLGNLDEVRVWSVARSATEIRESMYREVRDEPGLAAAIPRGGRVEVVSGLVGAVGSVTEQVFGMVPRDLVVPRAAFPPTADGNINFGTEYLGAEQLVVRYPDQPEMTDAVAYFVHTDNDLFVSTALSIDPPGDWNITNSWLSLYLDTTNARPALAEYPQAQLRTPLDGSSRSTWLNGDGAGGYYFCQSPPGIGLPQPCTPRSLYQVGQRFCGEEFSSAICTEFRVSRTLLGNFNEFDGVALGQFNFTSFGDQTFIPEDGLEASPLTWLTMTYGEGSANLPRVRWSGRIYSGLTNTVTPLPNYRVSLIADSVAYSKFTDSFGRFTFDEPVPAGTTFIFAQAELEAFGRYTLPGVRAAGIQPQFIYTNRVIFAGLPTGASGTFQFASVDFFVQRPLLVASGITSASPTNPMVGIAVRQGGVGGLGEWVTLTGTNLHAEMEYYLSPITGTFPTSPGAWTLIPAANVIRDSATSVRVQAPFVPDFVRQHLNGPFVPSFQSPWQWVARDAWFRPGHNEYSTVGTFTLRRPPYPNIHGFSFVNEDHDALLNEFLAGYGYSAYICVDPIGDCGAHIPDPLYWGLWWPVHKILIDMSTGSCVGFSGTAMELFNLLEIPQDYDPEALFANGIPGPRDHRFEGSPNPGGWGEFDTSNTGGRYTRPPIPKDIWARIRMNHGAQTSAEYLIHLISQLDVDIFSPNFGGDPVARLPELRAGTTAQAVCMARGFEGGHCVSPYRVEGNYGGDPNITRIWIYDNNHPCAIGAAADDWCVTNQFIDIDHSANEYIFPRSTNTWTGTALFTIPSRLYTDTRTAPGFIDFAQALGSFLVVVAGGADAHFTASGGREWGWRQDGTFVNNLPGLKAIPILGTPTNRTRSIPILLPISNGIPAIDIHMRGTNANVFHVAAGGTMLQLEMAGSTPGHSNRIRLTAISNQLSSFRFTPQSAISNFTPRIGFAISNGACATFQWLGLDAVSNRTQEFRALKSQRAVDYRNDSGKPTQHYLRVDAVDARTTNNTCAVFGPFNVPTGAVHCVVLHDWPRTKQVRSELDLNGDGVPEQVTIVTGTDIDSDGDGIPDAWETLHQLDPEHIDCDDDADNDGVSNLGEYLTDTDPRDPLSALRLTATMLPGNKVRLSWKAVPGRRYEIQYANGLEYVFQPLVGPGLPRIATATAEQFDDTLLPGSTRPRFYRLRVVP
jgi:hypothetical protein